METSETPLVRVHLDTTAGLLVPALDQSRARFILEMPEMDAVFIQNAFKQFTLLQEFLTDAVDEQMRKSKSTIIIPK